MRLYATHLLTCPGIAPMKLAKEVRGRRNGSHRLACLIGWILAMVGKRRSGYIILGPQFISKYHGELLIKLVGVLCTVKTPIDVRCEFLCSRNCGRGYPKL